MGMLRTLCSAGVLLFLIGACTALFVLQSLYFIFRHTQSSIKEQVKTVAYQQLSIPSLVICNRQPFSQDGVNSVSPNIRQGNAMRYLREWTNPSMRESADFFPTTTSAAQNGYDILAQSLPAFGRNQTINRMQYECQSVISSCSYQNILLSSYDCCRSISYLALSTPNGICWTWRDKAMWQNTTGPSVQFNMFFQIPRNSWYNPDYMVTHPGVDVYLFENIDDVQTVATEMQNPLHISDKKGIRLRMHMERRALTRRVECGEMLGDSRRHDEHARKNNETNFLICHMSVATRFCGCHPLLAEMMPLDNYRYLAFSRQVNSTAACSIDQYESCARRYVDLARIAEWDEDIPADLWGREDLEKCKSDNKRPCLLTSYPGTVDAFDLPPEYQSSQDFVGRLTLEYTSLRVTEILESNDPDIYELLSYIGYNLALWFCVGHILWSLFRLAENACCDVVKKRNKVSPASSHHSLHPPPEEIQETTTADS